MLRTAVMATALAVALGCGDKEPTPSSSGATDEAKPAPAGSGQGPSKATLEDAKRLVGPHNPWDKSRATLIGKLGEPELVEDSAVFWYVLEGDRCWELRALRAGDKLAGVRIKGYPRAVPKMFERCAAK